jgi:peptide/nickel transport system substrate-binding protein
LIAQNIMLSNYYQTVRPVPGGIYTEGVLGKFTNANPLYATSDADRTVSHLLFAGLFKVNENGKLVGDLAKDYSVDTHGTDYTVHLKKGLTWQDGQPLTSRDVVFTYQTIQNADAQSPLQSGWQGVTITAPDDHTVLFKLPGALASFPYGMTNGIVPAHLLEKIPAVDLRSADFNTTHPVGAGPFAWQTLHVEGNDPMTAEEQIALVPFENYAGGKPKLQEFVVHTFADPNELTKALHNRRVTAAEGLTSIPPELRDDRSLETHNFLLRASTMVFFKTTTGVLADQKLRQALVQSTDVPTIMNRLSYPTRAVREPFLKGQPGYDPSLEQLPYNLTAAQGVLDSDGWTAGPGGLRAKDGKPLTFTLTAADVPESRLVAAILRSEWKKLGVDMKIQLLSDTDFSTSLSSHSYDAVLYGITIGSDPDVFVYWDSTQADIRSSNRLNLSEYKNNKADTALEAGRSRLDPTLRAVKYKPFLQAWHDDAPAVGLYQPRLLYLTNSTVSGMEDVTLNTATDRFMNVQNWEVRQGKVTN